MLLGRFDEVDGAEGDDFFEDLLLLPQLAGQVVFGRTLARRSVLQVLPPDVLPLHLESLYHLLSVECGTSFSLLLLL